MSLFNLFRKAPPADVFPLICYDIAYSVLPLCADKRLAELVDWCINKHDVGTTVVYMMAADMENVPTNLKHVPLFSWHHGQLSDGCEYIALQYPPPPPMSIVTGRFKKHHPRIAAAIELAPYFSVVVREKEKVSYNVLGRRAGTDETTWRIVSPELGNASLGTGPKPELPAFLEVIARGKRMIECALRDGKTVLNTAAFDEYGERFGQAAREGGGHMLLQHRGTCRVP